nr:unnamed protein product [Callosobruchus analis]
MHPKKLLTFFVCSCCISVILVVFGILLICFTHIIYEAILKGNLVLQPGSSAFQVWVRLYQVIHIQTSSLGSLKLHD